MKNYLFQSVVIISFCFLIYNCAGTPLYTALVNDDLEQVKLEIESGKNSNSKFRFLNGTFNGTPILCLALENGSWQTAKYLIENGADVNKRNVYEQTPLMIASAWGNAEIVKLLIEKGADVNAVDKNEYSVLMHACSPKYTTDCLDLLISNGADINYKIALKENLKGYKKDDFKASLLTVSAMEYRQNLIDYFKDQGLKSSNSNPLVCAGFYVTFQNQNISYYDKRFEKNFSYTGKIPSRIYITQIDGISIKEIGDENWKGNSGIGEIKPGKHTFKIVYTSTQTGGNASRYTTRSEPLELSIDCQPGHIYVLHPIIFDNRSVQIKHYKFEL